jgi:hypothetical protein
MNASCGSAAERMEGMIKKIKKKVMTGFINSSSYHHLGS